jgi:uncharacterized protein YbcI
MVSKPSPEAPGAGVALAAISEGMVGLHKEYYGKGPTQARTYAVNDTILCILKGGFTTVEETLMADQRVEDVQKIRHAFQRTMQSRFTTLVEEALGRSVIGYMSAVHCDPDIAVELFMLAPADEPLRGEHEFVEPAA